MKDFKQKVDITLGKVTNVVRETTGKAAEYLSEKEQIYKAKCALDESKEKLEKLFSELGTVLYYNKPTSPERTAKVIRSDIKETLKQLQTFQAAYDELTGKTTD